MKPLVTFSACVALVSASALAVRHHMQDLALGFGPCRLAASAPVLAQTYDRAERSFDVQGLALEQIAGPILAGGIYFSRWKMQRLGTRPVPDEVKGKLAPYFPSGMVDHVRWLTLERELRDVPVRAECLGGEGGMTLGNIVVFSSEAAATDVGLWAHELVHVEQFSRMGIAGFAHRYSANWRRIEKEASARAEQIAKKVETKAPDDESGRPATWA